MNISNINKRLKRFMIKEVKTIYDNKYLSSGYKARFFNIREAARYLNISEKTIYNKLSIGTFPVKVKRLSRKKILFEISDIVKFADSL